MNLILNPEIIKFWFNYQGDVKVMDATLDEIFRGTPRPGFRIDNGQEWQEWPNPQYKLVLNRDQAAAFGTLRPPGLTFHRIEGSEWGTECPYGFHTNAVDVVGHPCPCRTNNLDLSVVTDFIIRDLYMEDPRSNISKRPWTEVRYRGNFAHYMKCMLLGDKHWELFQLFKDTGADRAHPPPVFPVICNADTCNEFRCGAGCANFQLKEDHNGAISRFKTDFYEFFSRPDFQAEPQLLGYAVGDVVGLALVARFLMTTENPRL